MAIEKDLMAEARQLFFDESVELLENAEDVLLKLESTPDDPDLINELFRNMHTIKGSAGLFGLDAVVAFTHRAESVLDITREGELSLDDELLTLLLESSDHIGLLIKQASGQQHEELSKEESETEENLVKKLDYYLTTPEQLEELVAEVVSEAGMEGETKTVAVVASENWHLSLRFGPDALRNGMDPSSFLRYLHTVGDVIYLETLFDDVPPLDKFDPESCYLGFEINLKSEATKEDIEGVFEFVQDDCLIHILAPHSLITDFKGLIEDLPETEMRIGEILCRCGALTEIELAAALKVQQDRDDEDNPEAVKQPLGEVLVDQGVVHEGVVEAAAQKQQQVKDTKKDAQQSVRVNAGKLEELIDLVGELVISGANTTLLADRSKDVAMIESMEIMSRLVEDIRDTALGLRMVQIGDTFNRFRRVVREISKSLGKDIQLVITGGDTELDKTVVEKIGDPLTHLVRNSIDHGIESPAVRVAAGKSEQGTVTLNAYHDSGSIVIQIVDDGGGLNKDKILSKAIEKGLVTESQSLTDSEIYRLVFEPGFSTADEVSNLSGRGVGMDVVRRNIDALRGQVDVTSEAGKGSTFSIRLPLTLAIIDGFQVRIGSSHYIVPLDMVVECVELGPEQRDSMSDSRYINLRGEVLPLLHMGEWFGSDDAHSQRENIVVVNFGGHSAGLVVDELLGEYQTVIKPLGPIFQGLRGLSGATILGSGEVAMIVDVAALIKDVVDQNRQQRLAGKGNSVDPSAVVH